MAEKQKVKLTVSGLLDDVRKLGLSRKEIAVKYGVPTSAILEAFKHPKLKGARKATSGASLIDLEDDLTVGEEEAIAEPSSALAPAPIVVEPVVSAEDDTVEDNSPVPPAEETAPSATITPGVAGW